MTAIYSDVIRGMYIHFKVRRWVVWWFYIGVICGSIGIVNILERKLTQTQEEVVLVMGVIHWILGGIACYFYDSVYVDRNVNEMHHVEQRRAEQQ